MADGVDWNALAAQVQASFAATGQWFVPDAAPPPAAVDWDALAAQVQANFTATGQWFVPDAAPPPAAVDWDALAAQVQANFAVTGQWFASPAPTLPYMLFSRSAPPPGTRDLWQPFGLVGETAGSTPGLVDGAPAAVPLSAFNAFHGADQMQADWSVFRLQQAHGNAALPGAAFLALMGPPQNQGSLVQGNVFADAGPANLELVNVGTASDHILLLHGLAPLGSAGHVSNLEMLYPAAVFDQLAVTGFDDVRLKLVNGTFGSAAVSLSISGAARGEVDARGDQGPNARLGLTLALTSGDLAGDHSFTVFGTPGGGDVLTLVGGAGKVLLQLGAGHDVVDAAASSVALEICGGPDLMGTKVTPGFTPALGEGAGPGVLTFGGPVLQANLFYAGLHAGDAVPVTLTRVNGEQVQAVGHAALAVAPGETLPRLALHVAAPFSFVSAQLELAAAPQVSGNGLALTSVPFAAPRAFAPEVNGDGTVITLGGGADVVHFAPGQEGGLMLKGFDVATDLLVLDGADPALVWILEVAENSGTPAARVSTLVAFGDVAPGAVLHELVYLPGVSGLELGQQILIG